LTVGNEKKSEREKICAIFDRTRCLFIECYVNAADNNVEMQFLLLHNFIPHLISEKVFSMEKFYQTLKPDVFRDYLSLKICIVVLSDFCDFHIVEI
jgi:hypothetical protein